MHSWHRMKDDLLLRPLGSFQSVQWTATQELLAALKTQRGLDGSSAAVADGFLLLDRLAAERVEAAATGESQLDEDVSLDLRTLGAVLGAWRRLLQSKRWADDGEADIGLTVPQVLDKVDHYRQVGLFEPNAITYTVMLDLLRHGVEDADQALRMGSDIFDRLLVLSQDNAFDSEYHPTYLTVLKMTRLWARTGFPEAADRISQLVHKLLKWYQETRRPDLRPTLKLYTALLRVPMTSKSPVTQRLPLVEAAWEACKRGEIDVYVQTLNEILQSLARTKQVEAANLAHTIFVELLRAYRQGHENCRPDQFTFLAVISALGRTGKTVQAEEVMSQMEDMYYETSEPTLRPNKACYTALIWAYVKAGDSAKAEATLLRLSKLERLDTDSWNGVLASWVQAGTDDAVERTATVVKWLQDQHPDGEKEDLPITTYNTLMGNYAKSENPQQGVRLASDLFAWLQEHENKRLRPNGITYLSMITAWRNAGNPSQAEAALLLATQQSPAVELDARHFNICISSWAESKDKQAVRKGEAIAQAMEGFGVSPDLVTYNALIKAHSRHGNPEDGARKCLALLRKAQEEAITGRLTQRPDLFSYNTTMAVMSRVGSRSVLSRSMSLFQEMQNERIQPDRATYNNLMSIYARLGEPDKVEQVFRRMEAASDAGDDSVKPHFQTYTTLLQAWSKMGEPEKTLSVLEEMLERYESGRLDRRPASRDFDTVLQAWLRSGRPDAAAEALKGLETMEELAKQQRFDCVPNIYSYNTVLSAFAKTESTNAGTNALALLRRMQDKLGSDPKTKPNFISYSLVVRTLVSEGSPAALDDAEGLLDEMLQKDEEFWGSEMVQGTLQKILKLLLFSASEGRERMIRKLVDVMEFRGIHPNEESQYRRSSRL